MDVSLHGILLGYRLLGSFHEREPNSPLSVPFLLVVAKSSPSPPFSNKGFLADLPTHANGHPRKGGHLSEVTIRRLRSFPDLSQHRTDRQNQPATGHRHEALIRDRLCYLTYRQQSHAQVHVREP